MITNVHIQHEDFELADEIEALTAETTGAVASFVGVVRGGGDLDALVLEHYPGMTEREIGRIVEEAGARWTLEGVTVIHRVGRLEAGARIVLVVVAAAHRAAAFEASAFVMDYLKNRAPFSKQEERHGEMRWVEAKASDDDAAARWRK